MPSKKKPTGRKATGAKKSAKPTAAAKKTKAKKTAKGAGSRTVKPAKAKTPARKRAGENGRGAMAKPSVRRPAAKAPGRNAAAKLTAAKVTVTKKRPRPEKAAPPYSVDVLSRAEADINAAIESLNNQMNAAVSTLTELAASHRDQQAPVVRTAPMDRVTAVFQRLVSEVVDEQLGEILPALVSLRSEMTAYDGPEGGQAAVESDFFQRGRDMLDQVLGGAGVHEYDARAGQAYDPLIHLAVGETARGDLDDGTVSEWIAPGFRTSRGKVLVPARVKVNRK